jgi:uncharacterized protein YutE (UPF0331/DUF86 family)
MLENDAILSKISIIQNCLQTIKRATGLDSAKLDDLMIQDVFVLNVQRAAQAAIDMANLVISKKGLKLPATYKEAFAILAQANIITAEVANKMGKMVGFRNIAIHDYRALDLEILKAILQHNLSDFEEFYAQIFSDLQAKTI